MLKNHLSTVALSLGVASPLRRNRPLRAAAAAACLLAAASCSLFASSGPPRQKGEPSWSGCVTGSTLEKVQNCAEYCASQNLACQNNGCGHVQNPSTRYGGASYDNSICAGNAVRSYQCSDPFMQDGAARC